MIDDPKNEVGSFDPPPAADRKRVTFAVPPSAPVKACRSCGAKIVWIVTTAGRRMPLDVPSGESHFATCPDHRTWRRS